MNNSKFYRITEAHKLGLPFTNYVKLMDTAYVIRTNEIIKNIKEEKIKKLQEEQLDIIDSIKLLFVN